jgi:hypothetical protein
MANRVPGPRNALRSQGLFDFWHHLGQKHGDVARTKIRPQTLLQFVLPEHVQYILVKKKDKYDEGRSDDTQRIPLGHGSLTAEGELWRRQ